MPSSPPRRLLAITAGALALSVSAAGAVRAAEDDLAPERAIPTAEKSASTGAFLPWTMGARSDPQRALVYTQGGYDGAERGAVFQALAEAQILGRLSLRAGGGYVGPSGTFRPEAGLRVDALRQERHGIDLAVLGVYEAKGFNTVRAVTARVAISRAFGATRLVSNVGYGVGLEESERYGDFRLAGLRGLTTHLQVGLDSRLRVDLERDDDEPAGEPDWEVTTGPLAAYSFDRFVVTATAGLSALKRRLVPGNNVGAIGAVGFGAVF